MPNYKLIPCDGDINKQNYVLSSETTLNSGDTYQISYNNYNSLSCFQIGEITNLPPNSKLEGEGTPYNTCLDCFTGYPYYLIFKDCNNGEEYSITTEEYFINSEITEIPIYNKIYQINSTQITDTCLKFLGINNVNGNIELTGITNTATFSTCLECLPPLSSGTEVSICQVCTDSSGNTIATEIIPPHPTWTDGSGRSVIQLNMIELGGQNGLNN